MRKQVEAEHGVVVTRGGERFGYFGWPSVARMSGGDLVVACSGPRTRHVCPWGKTVLVTSRDEGRTWSEPDLLNDTPLDDRDAGIVNLNGDGRLVSHFTSDTRTAVDLWRRRLRGAEFARWEKDLANWTDELVDLWLGSWVRLNPDGRAWSAPIKVAVSAPHGPILLSNGDLLYLGKENNRESGPIRAIGSGDGGRTWSDLGSVAAPDGVSLSNLHEPHAVELASGKLIGLLRYDWRHLHENYPHFSLFQTESEDGGKTWTPARPLHVAGAPPHLIRHSSGALVCVYGDRLPPFGQRAMISRDDGQTWDADYVLRDLDYQDLSFYDNGMRRASDLGYPASAELPDGSLFTVYYQRLRPAEHPSILWTRWQLPEEPQAE